MALAVRRGGVNRLADDHGLAVGELAGLAGFQVVVAHAAQPRVDVVFRLTRRDEGAAVTLAAVRELVMEKLARVPVERRRHGAPARHEQNVLRGDERALRSHAREGRRIVRLLDELRAGAVVHPRHLTRLGVHRVNERAHERPDARGEIHAPIAQHRAAARGPRGDDALVAEHLAVGRPAAQLPHQRPVLCAHAVEMPVVAGEIDFALPRDRREAHRAVRVKCPEFLPRPQVKRHHLVRVVEADEHAFAHHHRLKDAVIRHQVVVERVVPHLHARRILPGPLQM